MAGARRALLLAAAIWGAPAWAWGDEGAGVGDVTLSGSIGLAVLEANEYVYNPDGSKLSHLIWETDALPVATFEAEWRAAPGWALLGSFSVGLDRGSYMEDYDWFYTDRDWSHRSRHPDTPLDRYLALDVALRRDLLRDDDRTFGLLAGFRYTNVKWTTYGGDFLYSSAGGFRDLAGSFPDADKGISYEQSLPALYLGPTAELPVWRLRLSGSVVGGVSFQAHGVDDHWQRDLRFDDDLGPAPYLGVQARLAWPLGPAASLFLGGRYERHFTMKGSTTTTDTTTGETFFEGGDAAGGAFEALRLDAGLSVRF